MATIQIAIEEELLIVLDDVIRDLGTSRGAFVSEAIQFALRRHQIKKLEERHALGYALRPPQPAEFDGWESEQVWTDG